MKRNFITKIKSSNTYLYDCLNSLNNKTFLRFSLLFYTVFVTVNILTHEMWRDEMQAWLIATNSNTIGELFSNLKYEYHPPLWHLLLYFPSRITHHPSMMQFVHLVIAISTAYIFLKFAPFSRLQRLIYLFGYFTLYEYATISRSYSSGILLIFLFCILFKPGTNRNYFALSAVLFLLILTSAYGFIIAISLACMMVFEFIIDRNVRVSLSDKKSYLFLCVCLFLTGLLISAVVIIPEADSGIPVECSSKVNLNHFQKTLSTIWQSLVPLPRLRHCYWNKNIIPGKTMPTFLSILLLCFLLLSFARKRLIFFLFCFSFLLLLGFQYLVHLGYLRHSGHLFILFVVCLWIGKYYRDDVKSHSPLLSNATNFCIRHKNNFFNILLGIHLAAGIFASGMDWFYPFSKSKDTARYIQENQLDKLPILGDLDFAACAVAGYLDMPIYYPKGDRFGTFLIYDNKRAQNVDEQDLLRKAFLLARNKESDILLLLNYRPKINHTSIVKLKEFCNSIQDDENYYLYLLKYSMK